MNLIEWLNGITKLNKKTMDEFQNNIKDAIDEVEDNVETNSSDIEDLKSSVSDLEGLISVTSNSNGTALKFSNGIMICYKTVSFSNVSVSSASGSLYNSSRLSIGNFAESFSATPQVNVSLSSDDYTGFIVFHTGVTSSSAGSVTLARSTSVTSARYVVNIIAIGTYTV